MALEREEDWQLFLEISAVRVHSEIYGKRLEPIISPPLFDKPIIRILTRSISAKEGWLWSGFLIQEIGLGMEFQRWRIPLDRKSIVQANFSQKYRLRFEPVGWLEDISIRIDTHEG